MTSGAALRKHGVEQVQLMHPPWFDDEFDQLGDAYLRDQGFDVVVSKALTVPGDPARVEPRHVVDWVEHDGRRVGRHRPRAAAPDKHLDDVSRRPDRRRSADVPQAVRQSDNAISERSWLG